MNTKDKQQAVSDNIAICFNKNIYHMNPLPISFKITYDAILNIIHK